MIAAANPEWRTSNRTVTTLDSLGRHIIHLDERPGSGLYWNPTPDFTDGDIEVDLRGRDVYQKSFLGVAFHIESDTALDVVWLRPFNFRAADSTHRAHAVQYAGYPEASWERLRGDFPGKFEAPLAADPSAWIHLHLMLRSRDLKIFIDKASAPVLHVQTTGKRKHGGVGLWVGDFSPGDFANLKIRPR